METDKIPEGLLTLVEAVLKINCNGIPGFWDKQHQNSIIEEFIAEISKSCHAREFKDKFSTAENSVRYFLEYVEAKAKKCLPT
jgi:hypothetical protein